MLFSLYLSAPLLRHRLPVRRSRRAGVHIYLALLPGGRASNAGAAGSISQAGAQYALDAAIPMVGSEDTSARSSWVAAEVRNAHDLQVEQHFGTINIPDQNGNQDSFDWSLTDLSCVGLTIGSGAITTNPTTGIGATIAGVGIGCSGNWHARETVWPHPSFSGGFKVTMSGTTGGLALMLVAPNGYPVATANNIVINVGSIDISFSGDKILDWLISLFKGKIERCARRQGGAVAAAAQGWLAPPPVCAVPSATPSPRRSPPSSTSSSPTSSTPSSPRSSTTCRSPLTRRTTSVSLEGGCGAGA